MLVNKTLRNDSKEKASVMNGSVHDFIYIIYIAAAFALVYCFLDEPDSSSQNLTTSHHSLLQTGIQDVVFNSKIKCASQ